jgi:putative endonuclease
MMATALAWHVYILCCADGTLYTGITTDLERRLAEHNAGKGARYTAARRPVTLAWDEPAADRSEAARREAELRRLGRKAKLELVRRGRDER